MHMEAAEGAPLKQPATVEDVFLDFKGRRTAIVKALTTDFKDFIRQCDPEKDDLCLYGFPNEVWQVDQPADEVPAELPEPVLGINYARVGMKHRDWLSFVAAHSDAWLLSVAMFYGTRFGFDKTDRGRLFDMINDLPTVFEVVVAQLRRQGRTNSSAPNHDNSRSKANSKRNPFLQLKFECITKKEHGETLCGVCGEKEGAVVDGFWICCDICKRWFHGKCVKITRAKAEYIKHYKCPTCSNKKLINCCF